MSEKRNDPPPKWGPGYRAKRMNLQNPETKEIVTAWYAEIQHHGKWHGIGGQDTRSGCVEGRSAHDARKKAKAFLDEKLKEMEEANEQPS